MGTIFKPVSVRPLPSGASVTNGVARWRTARGGPQHAPVRTTPRGQCVAVESSKYVARYRDANGVVRTVPTGCRDEVAARAVLAEFERRVELVKSGVISAAEDAISTHGRTTITSHVEAYFAWLALRGVTPEHLRNVRRQLKGVVAGCRFNRLADIRQEPVERWLAGPANQARSARTRNTYLIALKSFVTWCLATERIGTDPLSRLRRADEHADRRRQPRALTPEELGRLLDAARRRPLEEALRFNRGWRKSQPGARLRPETIAKLEVLGRERALTYKALVLTGLRLGELAALRVCDAVLEGPNPHLILEAKHEKNRHGSRIPLRPDLRDELAAWVAERGLARTAPLFRITESALKVFDRDLRFAGITKRDERGRTVCIHSLRHTFATLLSRGGVAPRVAQAAMRHSDVRLTMQVYTDPQLLDVAGALGVLPELPLGGGPTAELRSAS